MIAAGFDASVRTVYEDEETVAFFPLNPATRGHTLVIHREHRPVVWEMTPVEMQAVARTVLRVSVGVQRTFSPSGLNIVQSNGAIATQSVPHVHFHVVPRYTRDRFRLRWPRGSAGAARDLQDWRRQVSAEIAQEVEGAGSRSTIVSAEDRRQHLSFIQSVITRMSQASSSAKTWVLPIVTVSYGYSITRGNAAVAVLGLLSVATFAILDANYLKQERSFRRLYDRVAKGEQIPVFSMNPTLPAPTTVDTPATEVPRRNYWPDWADLKSWAIAPVYLPLFVAGAVVAAWAVARG